MALDEVAPAFPEHPPISPNNGLVQCLRGPHPRSVVLCAVALTGTVSEECSDAAADGGSPGHPGFFTVKVQPVYCSYGELQGTFAKFGDIDAVVIKPGTPPYGFITFAAEASAVAASEEPEQNIRGVWCRVALKGHQHKGWSSNGLALFNIPKSTTYEEVCGILHDQDGLIGVKWTQNGHGQFKGYAFAYFCSMADATRAKHRLEGLMIGANLVEIKYAHKGPKDFFSKSAPSASAAGALPARAVFEERGAFWCGVAQL